MTTGKICRVLMLGTQSDLRGTVSVRRTLSALEGIIKHSVAGGEVTSVVRSVPTAGLPMF